MRKASSPWIERLARVGYATKGVVYIMVGVLAVRAAMGAGGSVEGTQGAISEIGDEPFGQVLLALIAFGLLAYAVWRLIQASLDPAQDGHDAKAVAKRAGYLVSGLVYLGLALGTAAAVLGKGSGSSGGGSEAEWTARLLAQPFGQILVALVAAIVVGMGLYHFRRAYTADFMDSYDTGLMDPKARDWAERIGRFGMAARGVVFCITGFFLMQAALTADPQESRGLEGALESLLSQPFGPWLLGIVAAGLAAYGVFCGTRARYSQFQT